MPGEKRGGRVSGSVGRLRSLHSFTLDPATVKRLSKLARRLDAPRGRIIDAAILAYERSLDVQAPMCREPGCYNAPLDGQTVCAFHAD